MPRLLSRKYVNNMVSITPTGDSLPPNDDLYDTLPLLPLPINHTRKHVTNMLSITPTSDSLPLINDPYDTLPLLSLPTNRTPHNSPASSLPAIGVILPTYSFIQTEEGARLKVDLPSVARDHIIVEVEIQTLSITGKRFRDRCTGLNAAKDNDNTSTQGKDDEMGTGNEVIEQIPPVITYSLEVDLGLQADSAQIAVESLQDGVLAVNIPSQKSGVRRVEIK